MKSKRAIGTIAVLALVIGACGGDDDDAVSTATSAPSNTDGTTDTTDTTGTESTTADTDGAATTAVAGTDAPAVSDGRLRFAHYLGFMNVDPDLSTGGPDIPLLSLVYDTLVKVSPTYEALPSMAESWEYSEDGLALDFFLREGITFTDGSAFDADVVKANIERSMTLEGNTGSQLLRSIDTVEVIDPLTVRINLSTPDTTLPYAFSERPGMMNSPAELELAAITEPIGSGPFILTDVEAGVSAAFDRNPDYWNAGSILVSGADMSVVADSTTRLNALASGEIDLAQLDSRQLTEAEGYGLGVLTGADARTYTVQMNPLVEPAFADPNVRLAVSLAIDRAGMVSGIFFDNGVALDQVFLPDTSPFSADLVGTWEQDVERAQQLMADAGYADGFSITMVSGVDTVQGALLEAIQAQLAAINITVEVQQLPGGGPGQAYWTDQAVASMMSRTTLYPNAGTPQKLFMADVQQNPGDVTSPTIDALIAEALAEADADAQDDILRQISAEIVESPLGVIPVVSEKQVVASTDRVTGVQTWLHGFPVLEGVGITD